MTIKVLIVDDSALMRRLLESRLAGEADIDVVGSASNAQEARAMMKELDPDVVTLDIEMPGMDGLSFLEKIMTLRPTPVIIVSGWTQEGDEITAKALNLGAVSCYAKDANKGALPHDDRGRLANLVRGAAASNIKQHGAHPARPKQPQIETNFAARKAGLIAIGSSTGGVEALRVLLADFPADCPPTVIVQHVHARFAPAIADTLAQSAKARVVMAESDLVLKQGHIYFAPGGEKHLLIAGGTSGYRSRLRQGELISGHRPSVDGLFASVAAAAGPDAIGILLTGMGRDGADGLLRMKQAGARTIAQDEASCVVFGMPRAAIELGAADAVLPLSRMARQIFVSRSAECAS